MTEPQSDMVIGYEAPEPGMQAAEVLRLFEAKAVTWAAKYGPDGPLADRLARLSTAVSRYARTGDQVLDLGCGTGELARAMAAAGLRVTGCDISPQMLLRAASVTGTSDGGGCVSWVRLRPDWRRLPFTSAAFNVVVAASVLEYVTEPTTVLRECARVLRPEGVVLYTVPDLRHPVRWAEWLAHGLAAVASPPLVDGPRSQWERYHAYLRASRQRHRLRWWLAASGMAGLRVVPCPADGTGAALRLLVFCRPDSLASGLLSSQADEEGAGR